MFSLFGKKDKTPKAKPVEGIPPGVLEFREALYSNTSLEPTVRRIDKKLKSTFPWSNFIEAHQALKKNDDARAVTLLKQIVDTEGLRTHNYLQAWHSLIGLRELPPEIVRGLIQGVVVEYHMDTGLDIVAAYADHTARYLNYSSGFVWEWRDPEIDKLIDDLLNIGQEIMNRIGIGQREILPVPEKGILRIFLMAFDGSCFGEGFYDNLYQDEMGRYAINASYKLMMGLMKKQEEHRKAFHKK